MPYQRRKKSNVHSRRRKKSKVKSRRRKSRKFNKKSQASTSSVTGDESITLKDLPIEILESICHMGGSLWEQLQIFFLAFTLSGRCKPIQIHEIFPHNNNLSDITKRNFLNMCLIHGRNRRLFEDLESLDVLFQAFDEGDEILIFSFLAYWGGDTGLLQLPLPNLRKLSIEGISLDFCIRLANVLPPLRQLTKLNISSNHMGFRGIEILAQGEFPILIELNINDNELDWEGIRALAQSTNHGNFPILQKLDISDNRLGPGPSGGTELARGTFAHLTTLNISHNNLDSEWGTNQTYIWLVRLTTLNISHNNLEQDGARKLAESSLPRLITLNISHNNLDLGGRELGYHRDNFPSLLVLYIASNIDVLGGFLTRTLCGFLKNLRELDIDDNNINYRGIVTLVAHNFNILKVLKISHNQLGPDGAMELARSTLTPGGNFHALRELDISENGLGLGGATALAQGYFPNLKILDIAGNELGLGGATAIAQGNFPRLYMLNIRYNNIYHNKAELLELPLFKSLLSLEW